MATYSKKKLLQVHPSHIETIAKAIKSDFEGNGFDVNIDNLISGGNDISITKGGIFKAVLGMRSALKVALVPQPDGVLLEANVGIYCQQAIPAVISMFVFWPVLLTQIWGLIQQSALDDRALAVAEKTIENAPRVMLLTNDYKFCTNCGTKMDQSAKFCPECGKRLE